MEKEYNRSLIIKNLIPGLTERGKIKIGKKGEKRNSRSGGSYRLPTKLDHFLITTLDRDENDNFVIDNSIHKELGETPKAVPIKLLYDKIEMNFQCRYTCYDGKTLVCSGDGECALNKEGEKEQLVNCPCGRQDPKYNDKMKCKINGTLSAMVDCESATVGGVWKFRTTGYNSTVGILSSLTLIKSITGGVLAGIPLNMTIVPKVATNPTNDKPVTIYVVGIEYSGNVASLQNAALEISQQNALFKQRIEHMEAEALKLISVDSSFVDEAADIVEEYIPDELIPEMKPPPKKGKSKPAATKKKEPKPAPIPEPAPVEEQVDLLEGEKVEAEIIEEIPVIEKESESKPNIPIGTPEDLPDMF